MNYCPRPSNHNIELEHSFKGYLLLKDEYPLTIPYIKYNPKSDLYELKNSGKRFKAYSAVYEGARVAKK
jgi:hypothetical protein